MKDDAPYDVPKTLWDFVRGSETGFLDVWWRQFKFISFIIQRLSTSISFFKCVWKCHNFILFFTHLTIFSGKQWPFNRNGSRTTMTQHKKLECESLLLEFKLRRCKRMPSQASCHNWRGRCTFIKTCVKSPGREVKTNIVLVWSAIHLLQYEIKLHNRTLAQKMPKNKQKPPTTFLWAQF